jgi:hypothetical protein
LSIQSQFAHVLLFACPRCQRPLASACAGTKKSLEAADAQFYNPRCHCGWTGPVAGIEAAKHWVQPWRPILATAGVARREDGMCEKESHTD